MVKCTRVVLNRLPMLDKSKYFKIRSELVQKPESLVSKEKKYSLKIKQVVKTAANDLYTDFSINAAKLYPFWSNYPPEQRGRQPTGGSIPWLELGEKTISFNLIEEITKAFSGVRFPGLPTGGDVRFATRDALVHLDIKLTGPNDNPDELVVPPNQVSGRGDRWNKGVLNSTWPVYYQKTNKVNYNFQPKLPPFYILDDKVLLCITMFLKAVYKVKGSGVQPLEYFELACVPNGLLMFEGSELASTPGLIISGKDEKSKAEDTKRIRIRLDPLASIGGWRSVKIYLSGSNWVEENREKES